MVMSQMTSSSPTIRKAVICFLYTERIKSELMIAANLLTKIGELKGDERAGAEKIMLSFLDALIGEVNLAQNISAIRNFEKARNKISVAKERIQLHEYSQSTKYISEAISFTTGSGQWAAETLKEKNFI